MKTSLFTEGQTVGNSTIKLCYYSNGFRYVVVTQGKEQDMSENEISEQGIFTAHHVDSVLYSQRA